MFAHNYTFVWGWYLMNMMKGLLFSPIINYTYMCEFSINDHHKNLMIDLYSALADGQPITSQYSSQLAGILILCKRNNSIILMVFNDIGLAGPGFQPGF